MKVSRRKTALVAFGKDPARTPVKTRLAPAIGEEAAVRLYSAMLEDCISELGELEDAYVFLACFPCERSEFFATIGEKFGIELIEQVGEDLGQRMYFCVSRLLQDFETVFIFGTDLPCLPMRSIERILLDRSWDIALGPTIDGGYYTIGLRKCPPGLFDGIAWSTSRTLVDTVSNCVRHGLESIFLDLSFDVDDRVSLDRLCLALTNSSSTASRTRHLLKELNLLS